MNKEKKKEVKTGKYHNDYSPRYQEPYNIYEKARQHMKYIKKVKKEESYQKENFSDNSL